jgi:predicted phosphate transport protein (TIGR00153 family)
MQIFKKEKKVVELALRHAEITGESLVLMAHAIKGSATNNSQQLQESTSRVHRLESDADDILREIRELLYSGAYLPTIRGDIYRLLSAVDDVTNKIEDCLDFVNYQKPESLDSYQSEIAAILDLTETCYSELREALRAFFKPKGKVEELQEHSRRVGEIESSIDAKERALTQKIFESGFPIGEKLHMVQLLMRITRISDEIENAADELELLSLKSII